MGAVFEAEIRMTDEKSEVTSERDSDEAERRPLYFRWIQDLKYIF